MKGPKKHNITAVAAGRSMEDILTGTQFDDPACDQHHPAWSRVRLLVLAQDAWSLSRVRSLSVARASLTDVAGLISRDAGIPAGFADRTNFAAGEGGRVDGMCAGERSGESVVCVSLGKQGRLGGSRGTGRSFGARGGGQREQGEQEDERACHDFNA